MGVEVTKNFNACTETLNVTVTGENFALWTSHVRFPAHGKYCKKCGNGVKVSEVEVVVYDVVTADGADIPIYSPDGVRAKRKLERMLRPFMCETCFEDAYIDLLS